MLSKILFGTLVFGISSVLFASPSSYQKSCTGTNIVTNKNDGAYLISNCKKINGTSIPAAISIYNLHNIDGNLEFGRESRSTFQRTCRNTQLNQASNKVTISSICKKINGAEKQTIIELQNLHNIDGELTYK